MTDLVVVESQARARTLQDLSRGRALRVLACPGDLRRLLPAGGAAEGGGSFEPAWAWEPTRARVLRELRAAADGATRVLLATDPDARGELRAWHLAAALEPRPVLRLWLDAITPGAFDDALSGAQPLDRRLIDAELTRRLGFELVAEALARLTEVPAASRWSAALLLQRVAEREVRLAARHAESGLRLRARLRSGTGLDFEAELAGRVRASEAGAVREALEPAAWRVSRVSTVRRAVAPPPPLGVAALARAAEQELRFPVARTLEIARRLYEGKALEEGASTGLITWHMSAGGTRPTDLAREPDAVAAHLAQDECALYRLVFESAREAESALPTSPKTRLAIECDGWRFETLWPPGAQRPARVGLRRGAPLTLQELELLPPEADSEPRLGEAESLAELSGLGVSPPEEIPLLLAELEDAGLLVRRGVLLHPTRQGQRLLERIGSQRPQLLEARHARDFARDVAGVAVGRHGRVAVLAGFQRWLQGAPTAPPPAARSEPAAANRSPAPGLGLRCPRCARGEIVERRKRGGRLPFYACDRYPACRFTSAAQPVAGPCPSCGAPLLRARGRRTFCAEPGCGYARRVAGKPIIEP